MRDRFRLASAILALIAVVGCSEDSTAPSGQQEFDQLAGVWQVTSSTWGESTTLFPEGSTYWHFKSDGQYCIETRTGHGYDIWACGQVSPNLVLAVAAPSGAVRTSQLVLSEDGESLSSHIIEATGPAADRYDMMRSDDRDATDCECD